AWWSTFLLDKHEPRKILESQFFLDGAFIQISALRSCPKFSTKSAEFLNY
ncbi:hypothetical protein HMPREF9104_02225, partial [Lentilactobacillus kisonensis F0435]